MRLPDFLVIGAQKSGTTHLSALLAEHPGVHFSRPKELNFFCWDDVQVLPYPFFERYDEWLQFDWDARRAEMIEKYAEHFADARSDQLCGEGTPMYLPSRVAAQRAYDTVPDARIVAILRQPVDRAYSAYWQHVKMQSAAETFENNLRYEKGGVLEFGHYEEQLRHWASFFGRERLCVLLFEDYMKDPAKEAKKLLDFLGLDSSFDQPPAKERQNRAKVPQSPLLQRVFNRTVREYPAHFETVEYDGPEPQRAAWEAALSHMIRGLGRVNLTRDTYPPMNPQTRAALDEYYRRHNRGLADFLGRDLSVWGWD